MSEALTPGIETSGHRSMVSRLASSGLRRFIIQKYPGSIEGRFRFGSLTHGPLLWVVPQNSLRKQELVRGFSNRYSALVETGTYRGDMVEACRGAFDKIVSIELSPELHRQAQERFRPIENVQLLQGDSTERLKEVVAELGAPALFWLDAHYSHAETVRGTKVTPVIEELDTILSSPHDHAVLIDDARCFTGQDDYPHINELEGIVRDLVPDYSFDVANDVIRALPPADAN